MCRNQERYARQLCGLEGSFAACRWTGSSACGFKGVCLVLSELDEAFLEGVHDTAPSQREELVLAGGPPQQKATVDTCNAPKGGEAHY